jgi:hypothetical protein
MMNAKRLSAVSAAVVIMLAAMPVAAAAGDSIAVDAGVDLFNRYVWRGLDIASTPSVQPALSVAYRGFELGAWGAYTLSNQTSGSDEIDFWLSYSHACENGMSAQVLATDYYYPNAGRRLFNFNGYDDPDPGAHTLELGVSLTGPATFPVTVSGYVNVYNDAGNNTYFQVEYPFHAGETSIGLVCGVAGGSEENPGYYGTDSVNVINIGVSAEREIQVSHIFSVPLSVALIVNPRAEIAYLVTGLSF